MRDAAVVISVLARVGADDDDDAAAEAFAHGIRELAAGAGNGLLPAEQCSMTALEHSLDALESVSPLGKRNLLAACAAAAGADGKILPAEADLLRGLAEIWDCPMPIVPAAVPA